MSTLPTNPSPSFMKRNPHLYLQANPPALFQTKSEPAKKRIRQDPKPLLNKLEEEFKNVLLERYPPMQIRAQAIRFRLGNGIWYKPDFYVRLLLKNEAYEVKGPFAHRGGFENLKVAASLYPEIRWVLCWKEDGRWVEQEVLP